MERKTVWRVICNGAAWPYRADSLQDALRKIGQLAEREKLETNHDWNIEIRREK